MKSFQPAGRVKFVSISHPLPGSESDPEPESEPSCSRNNQENTWRSAADSPDQNQNSTGNKQEADQKVKLQILTLLCGPVGSVGIGAAGSSKHMFLIQEVDLLPTPSKLSYQQTHVSHQLMGIPEAGRVRGQGGGSGDVTAGSSNMEERKYFIPVSTSRTLHLENYSPPEKHLTSPE